MNNIEEATKVIELAKRLKINDNLIFDNDYGVFKLIRIE